MTKDFIYIDGHIVTLVTSDTKKQRPLHDTYYYVKHYLEIHTFLYESKTNNLKLMKYDLGNEKRVNFLLNHVMRNKTNNIEVVEGNFTA
jgi:hypothetical protein